MSWSDRATPLRGDDPGWPAGDVLAGEHDAAPVGLVPTGEHVKARRLACPVRADDAPELAGVEGQRHVLEHDVVAEALVQPMGLEERFLPGRGPSGQSQRFSRTDQNRAGCSPSLRPAQTTQCRPIIRQPSISSHSDMSQREREPMYPGSVIPMTRREVLIGGLMVVLAQAGGQPAWAAAKPAITVHKSPT